MHEPAPPEPCFATLVQDGRIALRSLDRPTRDALAQAGLDVRRDIFGDGEVRYGGDGILENPELHRVLHALVRAGIGFGEDQHGWGPADVMRELQSRGVLIGSFKRLGWQGERRVLLDNPPGFTPVLAVPAPNDNGLLADASVNAQDDAQDDEDDDEVDEEPLPRSPWPRIAAAITLAAAAGAGWYAWLR